MKRTRLALSIALLAATSVNAQQFSPGAMRSVEIDFPGLIHNYTKIIVDANMAPTGTPTWSPVETITVGRDGNNVITSMEGTTTFPIDIYKCTGTKTGNVYTSIVKTKPGLVDFQRETFYSDGNGHDTTLIVENYDTVAHIYKNSSRTTYQYDGNNNVTNLMTYSWTVATTSWTFDTKRTITYNGVKYASDTFYNLSSNVYVPVEYHEYYYAGNVLDSSVWYKKVSGVFTTTEIYSFDADANNKINIAINYSYSSKTSSWKPSTRSTFSDSGATSVATVAVANQFAIYPVPAANVLYVKTATTGYSNMQLYIFNIAGQTVNTTNITGANTQLDIANLANGTYIVRIENEGKTVLNQKVVVIH